ncbi:amidohydrolase family protein [Clostridium transplantifaecale]|uniref:amidohydrolase family protein n=1 Tax=Clostridium transplantifaecale TaxID=2479838 RepID=UPI000F642DDA|nr:amidohydrolase family protein [Clostridium transplantifaecale]
MKLDVIIKNGFVVDPVNHVSSKQDIGIRDGKIAVLGSGLAQQTTCAKQILDAEGMTVIPGVIDMHVHVTELLGGRVGYYMAAKTGVTTIIDFAGPVADITGHLKECGCGLNVGCVEAVLPDEVGVNPSREAVRSFLDGALSRGALGLKILGGHFPLTPQASRFCVEEANRKKAMIACHAGSTENRSDILGLREAFGFAEGCSMVMAHINAYCRGNRRNYLDELREAFELLRKNPNVTADSHMAVNNGTSGFCVGGLPKDAITVNCLKMYGYEPSEDGLEQGIREGMIRVIAALEKENIMLEREEALTYWRSNRTRTNVSFPANLPSVAAACVTERRTPGGEFLIPLAATDGGGFPRNGLLQKLLAFYRLGYLSLEEVIAKCSINPARMFGLVTKGHLGIGADADITVVDLEKLNAVMSLASGKLIMENGLVQGRGGRMLLTEAGEKEAQKRQLDYQIVNIEQGALYKGVNQHVPNRDIKEE